MRSQSDSAERRVAFAIGLVSERSTLLHSTRASHFYSRRKIYCIQENTMASVAAPAQPPNASAGPSSFGQPSRANPSAMPQTPRGFDVVEAYKKAAHADRVRRRPRLLSMTDLRKLPHPIAAITALVELMEASTGQLSRHLWSSTAECLQRLPSLVWRPSCWPAESF